jgi:hypothetical protein
MIAVAGGSPAMTNRQKPDAQGNAESTVREGDDAMSRRTLSVILLATVALLFAGTSAATAAAKPAKKKPVTRTVVRSPTQQPDTQTGSRSQGM